MNPPFERRLDLGAAGRWAVAGTDERGRRVVRRLTRIARLESPAPAGGRRMLVSGTDEGHGRHRGRPLVVSALTLRVAAPGGEVHCALPEPGRFDEETLLPLHLLNVPAWFALRRGGVLLHAALVAHEGQGFVLAGRSGAGKSTAARRVPPPWEALADDMVLAVPDAGGSWRAHPFPTWGRVIVEGAGSWEVERSLPLAGVFFLEPAPRDEALPLGGGEALCLLNEVAGQVGWLLAEGMAPAEARALRLGLFANLARIAGEVPCRRLRATLRGEFWEELLRACGSGGRLACARG